MATSKLALSSFLLSLGGLVASAILFALIYFQWLPNVGYLWIAVTICLTQLPSLAMSIPCRTLTLGRAALALSSAILVGMVVGFLFVAPLSTSNSAREPAESSREEVSQLEHMDPATTSAFRPITLRADHHSKRVQRGQEGDNLYA